MSRSRGGRATDSPARLAGILRSPQQIRLYGRLVTVGVMDTIPATTDGAEGRWSGRCSSGPPASVPSVAQATRCGGCRPVPPAKRRSLRLLETTKTELNAIAAPAISGLRKPSAARGITAAL